jgi:hypothetical protein
MNTHGRFAICSRLPTSTPLSIRAPTSVLARTRLIASRGPSQDGGRKPVLDPVRDGDSVLWSVNSFDDDQWPNVSSLDALSVSPVIGRKVVCYSSTSQISRHRRAGRCARRS